MGPPSPSIDPLQSTHDGTARQPDLELLLTTRTEPSRRIKSGEAGAHQRFLLISDGGSHVSADYNRGKSLACGITSLFFYREWNSQRSGFLGPDLLTNATGKRFIGIFAVVAFAMDEGERDIVKPEGGVQDCCAVGGVLLQSKQSWPQLYRDTEGHAIHLYRLLNGDSFIEHIVMPALRLCNIQFGCWFRKPTPKFYGVSLLASAGTGASLEIRQLEENSVVSEVMVPVVLTRQECVRLEESNNSSLLLCRFVFALFKSIAHSVEDFIKSSNCNNSSLLGSSKPQFGHVE
ncbi:hypothetical protein IRJ41_010239 [Triplophysa rosa]|uniref:Uncharacterized protein n=1 Tax=Triplophysa rosa TaxID=992332 RepID=A0A9W8C8P7_TRIRA|nr:hypothetical protein IRJ41_010239 [Triplophysa rosa]